MPGPLLMQLEEDPAYLLQESDIAEIVVPRSPDSHKGTHGTIAIVTGSSQMAGAALMAAHGAVRSGAGKVFLRVPGATAPYCIGVQPEIMVRGVGTGDHLLPLMPMKSLPKARIGPSWPWVPAWAVMQRRKNFS